MIKASPCSALFILAMAGMIFDVHAQRDGFDNHTLPVPVTCDYTPCVTGSCIRRDGVEACYCDIGYTGLFCEIPIGECTDSSCDNGGICYDMGTTGRYCMCAQGYSGVRCEIIDYSAYCPTIQEGDMEFLPRCSLKQSLGMFTSCIDNQLPYLDETVSCRASVVKTVQCIYRFIENCSNFQCNSSSVYDYGGLSVYMSIAKELYNYESPFLNQTFELLCTPSVPGIGFPSLDKTFNIGSPVCSNDTIDQLVKVFIEYGNRTYHTYHGDHKCGELDSLRMTIYEIVKDNCEWHKIYDALMTFNITKPLYWQDIFQIAHEEFLNWRVPGCEDDHTSLNMCYFTSCGNGNCTNYNGTEICDCTDTGYTGMFCEVPVGQCAISNPCQNAGTCYDASDDGMYCICPEGLTGTYCEINDSMAYCPEIEEGDMPFLPRCSLKQSLNIFATCINNQLPYLDDFSPNAYMCSMKVWSTVQCIYKSVTSCSGLACWSAFEFEGFDIYERIAYELYDPQSPFMQQVYNLLCTPHAMDIYRNETFNIGSPVCTNNILDRLVAALIEGSIRSSVSGANLCSEMDDLRMQLFQIANNSCNWDKVYDALSNMNISVRFFSPANYWSDVLRISHQEFLNWRIHGCEEKQCPNNYCHHGDCHVLLDGNFFCTCYDKYSGDHCEKYDEAAVCPAPDDNDVEFFPKCTLRHTVDKTMQCLSGLPHQLFGQVDPYQCSMAYYEAVQCLGNMVGNCSQLYCKSIYDLPEAADVIQSIFGMLSGPGLSQAFCNPYGGQIILEYIRNALHGMNDTVDYAIGMICHGQSLRNVTAGLEWIVETIGRSSTTQETCNIIDTARNHAYESLMSSCDLKVLDAIGHLGKFTGHGEILSYVSKGISVVISMLHNYTLPMCQGIDGGPDPEDIYCPSLSYSSCQSEMADAYMCSTFKYKKLVSHWIQQIIQWGQYRASFTERNWNEFASMLGFQHSYGMAMGEHGFLEMLRANMECGYTSYMDCDGAHQFHDILGCHHCYRPGRFRRHGANILAEWTLLHKHALFLNKLYQTLMKETGGCGGGANPSMPPFTDFSTYFSTSTYSPGPNPGTFPSWSQPTMSGTFRPGSGTARPPFPGFSATEASETTGPPQQTAGPFPTGPPQQTAGPFPTGSPQQTSGGGPTQRPGNRP